MKKGKQTNKKKRLYLELRHEAIYTLFKGGMSIEELDTLFAVVNKYYVKQSKKEWSGSRMIKYQVQKDFGGHLQGEILEADERIKILASVLAENTWQLLIPFKEKTDEELLGEILYKKYDEASKFNPKNLYRMQAELLIDDGLINLEELRKKDE